MAGTERDLVLALRAELAAIDPSRECDREAERAGLDPAGRRRDPSLARLAVRLARREDPRAVAPFDWATRPEHCRMAWLRGRFLSQGSLSFANGRTHLELVVEPDEARALAAHLATSEMPPGWRIRRGRGVVTWKSAEVVNVVLRRIGAGPSLLELEARQIARTLRGELNRVLNAESANLTRTVAAAGRQLEAIAALNADGRLAEEPGTVRAVAAARRETPEATLGELADRLAIHRSAVQRALERIERLARA
ncbi:MAG: DNA-binding protein WhiA [Chloroflexi bacterium]|nr:DNA-binding protein WhiA [Chloroflexota bacterium]